MFYSRRSRVQKYEGTQCCQMRLVRQSLQEIFHAYSFDDVVSRMKLATGSLKEGQGIQFAERS